MPNVEKRGVAPVVLVSIAEALVRMDTRKQNEYHAPFLGNYSIMSKSNSCDIVLGQNHSNFATIFSLCFLN